MRCGIFGHRKFKQQLCYRELCRNGEVVTVRLSHKALSQQLLYNPEFLTIGQGTLVNMMHKEELSREGFLTKIGVLVPVPRRNYNIIKEKYNKFCFERLFCKNMP